MSQAPRSRPPLARVMFIHNRILAGQPVNATHLNEAFGVERRTIIRDTAFMRDDWDLPIEFDPAKNSYVYLGRVKKPPGPQISEGERLNAKVVLQAIETYRDLPFYPQLATAFEKLASATHDTISIEPAATDATVSLRAGGIGRTDLTVFNRLSEAAVQQRELTFHYRKPGDAVAAPRRVQPYHLSHRNHLWYLVGYDRDRRALRTFAVPRITKPKLLRITFQRPADFCPKAFFATALNAFGGNGNFRVVLRFSGATADRVAEREWHATQTLRWLSGRRLELTLVLGALAEVERWVLAWGPEAEVIAPLELRERVHQAGLAIARTNRQPQASSKTEREPAKTRARSVTA